VDYDQGPIGDSLCSAADSLQTATFPSVEESSPTKYPEVSDIRQAVLSGEFWAAIYSHPGASSRLDEALRNNDTARFGVARRVDVETKSLINLYAQADESNDGGGKTEFSHKL
jgi:hypothetical protein